MTMNSLCTRSLFQVTKMMQVTRKDFDSSRHSQSNFRKSNSIEFSRIQTVDWVRLIPAIERNRTPNFVWVQFPNQSNLIEQIQPNRTQSNGLCSIEFGYRTQSITVQWIAFDCVRWINSLGQRSCSVVWLPAWLLYASSGEPTYKESPLKTRFSRPFLMIIQ